MLAATIPNCVSYDPTFAYEVAVIIQDGLRRMFKEQEDVYLLRHADERELFASRDAEGAEEGIRRGMYLLSRGRREPRAARAAARLRYDPARGDRRGGAAGGGLRHRSPMSGAAQASTSCGAKASRSSAGTSCIPTQEPRKSYVEAMPGPRQGPIVAATDYMRAFAEQIRPYVPRRYVCLGTDGFGRSDYRVALRKFFEVDRHYVAVAALKALADDGSFPKAQVESAISEIRYRSGKATALEDVRRSRAALITPL